MKLSAAAVSRPGGRKLNEDYTGHLIIGDYGCYVLADGLGGHRGGEVASKTAVNTIIKAFQISPGASQDHLKSYIAEANSSLEKMKVGVGHSGTPKTTLVVFLTDSVYAYWAHVGDSRLYLFRAEKLSFQTKDHSVPQHLADSGIISQDRIRFHEDRNRLTSAFDGTSLDRVQYSQKPVLLKKGDVFLLCSDGFWEYVLETEMEKDLKRSSSPETWITSLEKRLLRRVEKGHDNYSALAIFVI